jgi:hypothetical protein
MRAVLFVSFVSFVVKSGADWEPRKARKPRKENQTREIRTESQG